MRPEGRATAERAGRVLRGELRLALRRLRRAPGYSAAVVVNLAFGIGTVAAFVAVLYGIVLRPLPYPDPDRLVVIEHELPGMPAQGRPTPLGAFQAQALLYAERSRQIEAVGVFGTYDAAVVESDASGAVDARYVRAGYASTGFLRALGARAAAGRLFEDEAAGGGLPPVLLPASPASSRRRAPSPPAACGCGPTAARATSGGRPSSWSTAWWRGLPPAPPPTAWPGSSTS